MPFQLLGNRVLLRRDRPAPQIGLIWIPEDDQQSSNYATILALGTGLDENDKQPDFPYQVGAKVVIRGLGQGTGTPYRQDGEDLLIVHGLEILGVVEDGPENPEPAPPLSQLAVNVTGEGLDL